MLNFSERKSKKNRIALLFLSILISIFGIGIIMLFTLEALEVDVITWQGFDGIKKLNKTLPDANFLLSVSESEAIKLIEENTPSVNPPPTVIERPAVGEAADHILKPTLPACDDYFDETLFIGDSRMVGLSMVCQDIGAAFYSAVGLSINQLGTKKVIKIDAENSYTVMEAIENDQRDFKRVYMMFGLNELGWSYPSVFIRSVRNAIEQIETLCPNAEICIMAIMPIAADKKVSIYEGAEANQRIREYNSLLLQLASDMNCWYLDSYYFLADDVGNLPDEFAPDGIHLYSEQNRKLIDYISCHAFAW